MNEFVFFYPDGHEKHYEPGHPERPERVEAICSALQEMGWWNQYPHLSPVSLPFEFLCSVHRSTYLDELQAICERGSHLDMDTYTTLASWQLALNAAGGAVAVASSVWKGDSRRGFSLTRPPGHHATINRGMGFCLLNNIALATEYLMTQEMQNTGNAKRLAIVDLDLHHGNGTQDIFWKRGDVLYISTHQSPLYPGTGDLREVGSGAGEGCTANFPLPPGTGDQGFFTVMEELILPLIDRFAPQMILVSFGFDPHWRDPLGHLMLSAAGYARLIKCLAQWADEHCDGKISLFLEGGYDLDAASACSQGVTAALLGETWQDPLGAPPHPEGHSWQAVVRIAKQIWGV